MGYLNPSLASKNENTPKNPPPTQTNTTECTLSIQSRDWIPSPN